jgi:hypothetical protein
MLRVTFADEASRDAFANRFKITTKVDSNQLDIGWHFLQFAKVDNTALDYKEVAVLTAGPSGAQEREFIVKGDPAKFDKYATVVKSLGAGFYLVKSNDGLTLGDHVDTIEHTSAPVTYLAVSKPDELHGDPTTLGQGSDWARIRLASRYRPLSTSFKKFDVDYKSKPEVIVMDSGIDFTHPEFQGVDTENLFTLSQFNGSFADDIGHGTAVASMVCGKNLGVASNVKLLNVKVGGEGYSANLIDLGLAIDAIVERASKNPAVTRVVNMSWGIARSAWLDEKVQGLLDMGITVVCAAGNDGISVEDISPAGIDAVITVGSVDKYDIPSGFNNISPTDAGLTTGSGLSLDLFAPGEEVTIASNGGYFIASGTSFAAPLVAGIAAELASLQSSMVPYADLKSQVLASVTKDALLFEDDKFSANQNNLAYLVTTDSSVNIKDEGKSLFLGVHETDKIVANLNSTVTLDIVSVFPTDPVTWSIVFADPDTEAKYSKFFSINNNGILNISEPDVALPEDTKLQIVSFRAKASTDKIDIVSPDIFFFQVNPLYKETLDQNDVSLALTNTNSISFFAAWKNCLK